MRDIHNPVLWFLLHIFIANAFLLSIKKFRQLKQNLHKEQEEAARVFIKLFTELSNEPKITGTDKETRK